MFSDEGRFSGTRGTAHDRNRAWSTPQPLGVKGGGTGETLIERCAPVVAGFTEGTEVAGPSVPRVPVNVINNGGSRDPARFFAKAAERLPRKLRRADLSDPSVIVATFGGRLPTVVRHGKERLRS